MNRKYIFLIVFLSAHIYPSDQHKEITYKQQLVKQICKGHTCFDFGRFDEEKEYYKSCYGKGYLPQAILRNQEYGAESGLIFLRQKHETIKPQTQYGKVILVKDVTYKYMFAGEVNNNFNDDALVEFRKDNFVLLPQLTLVVGKETITTDVIIAGTCDDKDEFQSHYNCDIAWLKARCRSPLQKTMALTMICSFVAPFAWMSLDALR